MWDQSDDLQFLLLEIGSHGKAAAKGPSLTSGWESSRTLGQAIMQLFARLWLFVARRSDDLDHCFTILI